MESPSINSMSPGGSFSQSPMPLDMFNNSKDMISSFNSNFSPLYRNVEESLLDAREFGIKHVDSPADMVKLTKVQGRVEG